MSIVTKEIDEFIRYGAVRSRVISCCESLKTISRTIGLTETAIIDRSNKEC